MAARSTTRRQTSYTADNRQMYVYGNAVPKRAPEPRRREVEPQRPEKVSRQIRQNRRKAMRVSKGYVVFMAVAAVLALIVCVNYVRLQSQITQRSENITQMQEELASMKEENTTKYNAIMDSVNLEEIKNKAINELGMTYANDSQIVTYDNPTGDYVQQYEKIPEDGVVASSKDVQN